MALELTGRIINKLAVQSGESSRGPWKRQEFILEYQEGNYPTQVCINVWGEEKVNELERYAVGSDVKVSINLSSREYNGRWYSEIRAWRIDMASETANAPQAQTAASQATTTTPTTTPAPIAHTTPATQATTAVESQVESAEDDGDLPF